MASWPRMKPSSGRALVYASVLLVFVGVLATSRAAGFLLPLLAALMALVPAAFARGRARLLASIALAASLAVAANRYADYAAEMDRWSRGSQPPSSERASQP